MKYTINYKNKKMKYGFIGMNKFASDAHDMEYKHKHPEHTIEVYKKVPKKVRLDTIHHEEMEEYLMKNRHFSYHKAHAIALRFEKLNKPFPKKNIKAILKKWEFEY